MHEEFCKNFHSPGVIKALDEAVNKTNTYLSTTAPKLTLLNKTLSIFTQVFESMGLFYSSQ